MRGELFIAVLLSSLLVAACETSPTGRTQVMLVPDEAVEEMGGEAFEALRAEVPESTDVAAAERVRCVAEALIAALDEPDLADPDAWHVVLFAQDDINAFALPGGYIGVFEGMLDAAADQHQLAAVIGHEIGHVAARHGQERVSRHQAAGFALEALGELGVGERTAALLGLGAQVGVMLPFDRAQETEADRLGLEYMARAGFDPAGAVSLWQRMAELQEGTPPAFLSTHPATGARIEDLEAAMPEAREQFEAARRNGRQPQCD
jgi:predicted Zn-dependent protease